MGRKVSPNMIAALRTADDMIVSVHGTVCDECEDQCYAVGIRIGGDFGSQKWSDVTYSRAHLDAVDAWRAVANECHRYAAAMANAAAAEHLRETHPTLW